MKYIAMKKYLVKFFVTKIRMNCVYLPVHLSYVYSCPVLFKSKTTN